MKESLISFETAKLAKEVGFNWFVYYYYSPNSISLITPVISNGSSTDTSFEVTLDDFYENHNLSQQISVPTQSLLQKWLREVHKTDVYVMSNFYNAKPKLGYIYFIDRFNENDVHDGKIWDEDQIEILGDSKGFSTYEEALENGLIKSLTIIKNE